MTCEEAAGLIVDALLDSLDDRRATELGSHLEGCRACAAEAEEMAALWDELGELPAAGPTARAGLRSAVEMGHRIGSGTSRRVSTGALRKAASILLLLAGGVGGYVLRGGLPSAPAPGPGASTFLLLVRGEEPDARIESSVLTAEYGAWAATLAEDGRLVDANKLADEPGRWVSGASVPDERSRSDVQGYFLITAPDYAAAVELAAASPHIRYGGTFEIRQIEPTG